MLSATIATDILNGLFSMDPDRNDYGEAVEAGKEIKFNNDVYLGLLIELPDETGNNVIEPNDLGDTSYIRIKLNADNRITKAPFIAGAVLGSEYTDDNQDKVIPAKVTNNGAILFPESEIEYTINGFGLFSGANNKDPFLWGEVTPVTVSQYEVPVIRSGKFEISLI